MIASPHYDRLSLIPELHRAADDMGEWALEFNRALSVGCLDNNLYRLAQEEAARKRVIAESADHFANDRQSVADCLDYGRRLQSWYARMFIAGRAGKSFNEPRPEPRNGK